MPFGFLKHPRTIRYLRFPTPAVRKYNFPHPVGPGQHRPAIQREVSAALMKYYAAPSSLYQLLRVSVIPSLKLANDLALARPVVNSPSQPPERPGQPRMNPPPTSKSLRQDTQSRATCSAPGLFNLSESPSSGLSAFSSFLPQPHDLLPWLVNTFTHQPRFRTGHDGVSRRSRSR